MLLIKPGSSIGVGAATGLTTGFTASDLMASAGFASSTGFAASTAATGAGVTTSGALAADFASACFCKSDISPFFIANSFCISAICFSSDTALSCASLTFFSRAVASSCSEAILSCNTFTLAESALPVTASPVESFTTSFGPVAKGAD